MASAKGYVRISKDDEENPSLSPSVQEETIVSYCKMKRVTLDHVYSDVGVSGAVAIADRPAGAALLTSLVEPGTLIVAVRQDRLFRDSIDALTTIKQLTGAGMVPVCIAEGLDLSTPAGKLMFTVMAGMNQYEREIISERTRVVLAAKKAAGKVYSGQTPYGWDATPAGELVENLDEQFRLRWMKNLRARGHGDRYIAREANERQIPSKSGGKWGHSSVRSVLDNERPPKSRAAATEGDAMTDPTGVEELIRNIAPDADWNLDRTEGEL